MPQFRCRWEHEGDEGRYLFTSTHIHVLRPFPVAPILVVLASSKEVSTAAVSEAEISSTKGLARTVETWRRLVHTDMEVWNDTFEGSSAYCLFSLRAPTPRTT